MKKETMESSLKPAGETNSHNVSSIIFDLPALIDKMKHSSAWVRGELNAMILLKSLDKQIVLTALQEGTEINSFQANNSVTFQIIEGMIRFHTRKESVNLEKGQLLTLDEKIKYSLTTSEETVFLMTISSGNTRTTVN
jgi:quercetin dioxygenase-like cupin family protein